MRPAHKISLATAVLAILAAVGCFHLEPFGIRLQSMLSAPAPALAEPVSEGEPVSAGNNGSTIDLTDSQLALVKVEPAGEREFPIEKQAVGSIDFNQDMTLQVFTPYQGRLIALFAEVGGDVEKGNTLFTVASPDLLQAEQTIIAAAGVLRAHDQESGTSQRTLCDEGRLAKGSGAGDLGSANGRGGASGRTRLRTSIRQDRGRD